MVLQFWFAFLLAKLYTYQLKSPFREYLFLQIGKSIEMGKNAKYKYESTRKKHGSNEL